MDNLNPWIKSSRSQGISNCIELQGTDTGVNLRDSKQQGDGPVLQFTKAELGAFIDSAKQGEFDHLT
jgi:hypothetical protein